MSKYPVALKYFAKYLTLGNLSVGRVTILFTVWQDLAIQIGLYKEAAEAGDKKEVNKRARKLNLYLEWLKDALEGGGKEGAKFIAPAEEEVVDSMTSSQKALIEKLGYIPDFLQGDNMQSYRRHMDDKIAADAVKAAMRMNISITSFNVPSEHVMAVVENILAFCRVMNDAARNCQEKTIDATKKFIEVSIPLLSPLLLLTYNSRRDIGGVPVGAALDFKGGKTSVFVNPTNGRVWKDRNGVKHYSVADYNDELRTASLKEATCMDKQVYGVHQEIPEVIKVSAKFLMNRYCAVASFMRLMAQFHVSVSNLDNRLLAEKEDLCERRVISEDTLEAFKKLKEQSRRNLVAALANQIRWFAATHPWKDKSGQLHYVKGYKLALIALGVCIERTEAKEETSGESAHVSSFAFTVLKEEFLLMVIHAMKSHSEIFSDGTVGEIFEDAVERLDVCNLEDGTTVEFKGGSAVEGNAFVANAKAIPDGTYTIRELDGKMFACKNIEKAMAEAIPQKLSGKFCFMTAEQVVEGESAGEKLGYLLKDTLDGAEEVVLAELKSRKCAVVADGDIIGDATLPALKLGEKEANSAAEFFKNKKGKTSYSRALVYINKNGKWAVRLFVVLEGVKPTVKADNIKLAEAKALKAPVAEEAGATKEATVQLSSNVLAALANLQS